MSSTRAPDYVTLTPETPATPVTVFPDQNPAADGHWGVPAEFFESVGRAAHLADSDAYTLRADLAHALTYVVDDVAGDQFNVAAPAQRVTVDGQTVDINPGFWCSYISQSAVTPATLPRQQPRP